MNDRLLPLEDTFGDILGKALRGNRVTGAQLADATGIDVREIAAWLKDDGAAGAGQANAIASALHLDGAKLAGSAARGWYPPPLDVPNVRRHAQYPHPSNGYVFYNEDGRQAALVDPAGRSSNLLRILREGEYDLQYVLITHKHSDHCDAAPDVAKAFPRAQIVMHELDVHAIGRLAGKALPVRHDRELPFGDGAGIRMLHTPGHTDGSSCYLFEGTLYTGDTLFAASVGGAYGDASTYDDILDSIRTKLFTLPPQTVVMPGHGPATAIGLEKAHNPFFSGS